MRLLELAFDMMKWWNLTCERKGRTHMHEVWNSYLDSIFIIFLGDAFLHLIPHAMMASGDGDDSGHGHSHSHGHSHGDGEGEIYQLK